MCNISVQRYVAASAGGMLLCQSLHAYIGSTLRSMEEVVSSSSSSTAACVVFGGQVCDFTCANYRSESLQKSYLNVGNRSLQKL